MCATVIITAKISMSAYLSILFSVPLRFLEIWGEGTLWTKNWRCGNCVPPYFNH